MNQTTINLISWCDVIQIMFTLDATICAAMISVFTLTYSFIVAKKNDILAIEEVKKHFKPSDAPTNTIALYDSKLQVYRKYIEKRSEQTKHCVIDIIVTLLLSIFCTVILILDKLQIVLGESFLSICTWIICILSLLTTFYTGYILTLMFINFHTDKQIK